MDIKIYSTDGSMRTISAQTVTDGDKKIVNVKKEDIGTCVDYVDFPVLEYSANAGDKGYFVLPFESTIGVTLTYFTEREDVEHIGQFACVSCYGVHKENGSTFGVIIKGRENLRIAGGVKNGKYYAYPRFYYGGMQPDGDIEIEYYSLKTGDYSEMARIYRQVQLSRFDCVPLKERIKNDKRLRRATESIAVRVRQGWKPAPSKEENQTLATEPKMHVACDFERTEELIDEFLRQDVKDAEICLVGWNRMGHDGRYPQIFPPEPALGGEEKLVKIIKKAKSNGFNIVGHDNACDGYTVSEDWNEEYLVKRSDGGFMTGDAWSGGRSYRICPKRYYELFAKEHIDGMRELGFEGVDYMDVVTILELSQCFDKNHPVTKKQAAEYYRKIMQLSKDSFGGFSSESGYDFSASTLDYAMYVAFFMGKEMPEKICDEIIPFWEIVYHGIIMYNPATYTLNYAVKSKDNRLKFFEYGGRPLACIYANFADGRDWMGLEDLRLDTDEQMRESVSKIKMMCDDYEWLKDVRYAFMDSHEKVADGVYKTVYSNGISVTVSYNESTVKMTDGKTEKVLTI